MKPTKTKLNAAVFVRAAKHVFARFHDHSHMADEDDGLNKFLGCCWAIDVAARGKYNYGGGTPYHTFFDALLEPEKQETYTDWWGNWYGNPKCPECLEARTLGLLLCASLVRDGWEVADFVEAGK
jgi:hypothetical protein